MAEFLSEALRLGAGAMQGFYRWQRPRYFSKLGQIAHAITRDNDRNHDFQPLWWQISFSAGGAMKRDFELIRKLLIFFEEKQSPEHVAVPAIDGYDDTTIKTHLVLMHDAGLLRCEPAKSSTSDRIIYVIPFELTWDGHEFLDKVRNETVWAKIRDIIASKGGSIAFSVINQLATRFAAEIVRPF
jgi:hypothetical protein